MTPILPILQALLDALRHELSIPLAERGTGASDSSLDAAIYLCGQAITALEGGQSAASSEALRRLARLAVDEWSLGSELTEKVADCAGLLDG
jgi:hypothetical protein